MIWVRLLVLQHWTNILTARSHFQCFSISDIPLGQVHIILLACICCIWHERRKEREVRCALCVLSSSSFFFFYTLCDLWSSAWSKFNILTTAAFNEGPLVCILSLWVIIVMQNIQVGGEPCPPFITCSRQELLQLRPAASSGADRDFNCSEIKLKPRKRGQRGGVWVRNNQPGF